MENQTGEIKKIETVTQQNNLKDLEGENENKGTNVISKYIAKIPDPPNFFIQFDAKPVSVFKLYYHLSSKLEVLMMIVGTIGGMGAGVAMPLFTILFGRTLSGYGAQQSSNASPETFDNTIGTMVTNFLIVGASVFVSYFLMIGLWVLVGMRQMHRLKELYFQLIMKQEQGWFDSNNAYEFSTKVQAQIKQIEGGVGEKMANVIMMTSQVFAGLIIALTTSWKLTLVILSMSPLITMSAVLMANGMRNGIIDSRKAYEKAGGIAEEVLYNIKTVASFANFDFEIKRFSKLIDECRDLGIRNGLKLGLGMGGVYLFMFSSYCIAIIYGSHLIINGEWNSNAGRNFQGGDVMTVIFSTIMAVSSLGGMAPNAKAIGEACVAASDYFTLLERVPQIDTSKSTKKPEKNNLTGRIVFENITFAYPSKPNLKILKNINMTFEPGQKVALVGESGSGKSTIVNLLERLYDWGEGNITIDGVNIKDFDVNYLRSLIGFVQQEPVLFNKSIKDNIIFGRDLSGLNANELIKEACEDSYANEFIRNIDGQYDYVVGIKGSKLSGGQKQRIAIARAILTKPKILLLDEATSALDNKSEKEVQRALDQISQKNVTTIIIAHRLSTVKNADKIYAIKNGEVIEVGTHKELLAKDGYYSGLVKSQMEENKTDQEVEVEVDEENADDKFLLNSPNEIARLNSKNPSTHFGDKNENSVAEVGKPEAAPLEINKSEIFAFLSDNKCNLFVASLGSVANGCVFPIYGLILASAINSLSNPDKEIVKKDGLFMGLMFLIIAVGTGGATFFQNYKFTQIGEILSSKLRKTIFAKYLKLHLGYFDHNENSPGALLTKLSIDTTLLNGIVLTTIGVTVQSLVGFSLGLILGFIFDWRLSLICLAFFPFIILSSFLQEKLRRGSSTGDEKLDIEAGSILSESVINTKTIFSYNFQDNAIDMYLDVLSASKSKFVGQSMISGVLFGLGQFALFASFATVFHAGGKFIMNGTLSFNNMTRAIMVIILSAFGVGIAQQYAGDYAKAKNAFTSLFSTLNTVSEIDTTEEANKDKKLADKILGKIEFKNVTFAYPSRPGTRVLKNLSFIIQPGHSIAFVGHSGSGKSTIVQLIERYYDVQEGQILIDDVDIKEYNLLSLRRKIGLVSQEPCLFKRSVRENILYGDMNATHDEVTEAAIKANIMKFFSAGDDGAKDTPVSGGEKQRLAIARVFLKNPKILLLDEATSALDKDSEDEVQKALNQLQGGRTSISIAHRLSTVENSDVIYVLEHGLIVEQGTHKEMYEMKEKYYTLHKYSSLP